MSKIFGLIGVGGYIAPRHLQAIKHIGGELRCAIDKSDSVGILDMFFPQADFFTEFERFDRHIDKLRRNGTPLDFVSICSPNYLHDSHIRFALRNGANAICEKPLVLNPWNLKALEEIEKESNHRIYTILQLRLHPSVVALKARIKNELERDPQKVFDIDLSYIVARGKWYFYSWKGDESKSGGIASNIGVHFFDMLVWIFGELQQSIVHIATPSTMSGFIDLKHARVRWFLSVDETLLPDFARDKRMYRSLILQGEEFDFSDGFGDLHTKSYEEILKGRGFGCAESYQSIELIHSIRQSKPLGLKGEFHPLNLKLKKDT